ncbi:hypothetical protein FOFC_17566 [Fusarium oxysporum]|nr:hypothetical protein FOFC_17566 [Fusarium oxysporum]
MTRQPTHLSRWAKLPVMAMRHLKGKLPMNISSPTIFAVLSLVLTWTLATVLLPRYKSAIASHIGNARQQLPSVNIDWSPNDDPRKNYNASKVAVIIESEPLPVLVPLILHMIAVVPPDWRFVFIGSKKSVFAVGREFGIQLQQGLGKIDLMTSPNAWPIGTDEDRNRLLTDTRFYEEFLPGAEWLLMFNYESILCANSEVSLNDWLDWDWAGAASDNEDKWFGKRLSILPNAKVANATDPPFAVENSIRPNPMGYYAPGRGRGLDKKYWKLQNTRQEALKYCPELHIILDMKLEKERCPNDNLMGEIVEPQLTS